MTLINVFAFSAVVMAFMLSFRMLEIKIGRDIISRNFRESFDELIVDIWKISLNWLQNQRKKFLYELKKVPVFLLHMLIAFWGFALRKTLKAVNLVQGRIDSRVKTFVQEHLEEIEKKK
jgi:hypothetical protein